MGLDDFKCILKSVMMGISYKIVRKKSVRTWDVPPFVCERLVKIPDCQDGLSFKLHGSCPPYVHAVKKGEPCVCVCCRNHQKYILMFLISEAALRCFFSFHNCTSLAIRILFNLPCCNETISTSVPNKSSKDTVGFTEY